MREEIHWHPQPKPRHRLLNLVLRSLVLGAFMGTANAIMVNCALIEISLSRMFALAFGFLFLASGAAVGWQATLEPIGDQDNRPLLLCFATLSMASGFITFLLERDWSHGLSALHKVFMQFPFHVMLTPRQILLFGP